MGGLFQRRWAAAGVVLGTLVSRPARAADGDTPDTDPVREGFTLELGIGAAVTFVSSTISTGCGKSSSGSFGSCDSSDRIETETFGGFAPLSLGVGGFFSEDVALLFRVASTSYFLDGHNWVNGFYGPALQIWPSDRVLLSAGIGLGLFGENPLLEQSQPETYSGLAFSARGGYAFFVNRDHALRATLEVIPGLYGTRSAVGTALLFEWQLL